MQTYRSLGQRLAVAATGVLLFATSLSRLGRSPRRGGVNVSLGTLVRGGDGVAAATAAAEGGRAQSRWGRDDEVVDRAQP